MHEFEEHVSPGKTDGDLRPLAAPADLKWKATGSRW